MCFLVISITFSQSNSAIEIVYLWRPICVALKESVTGSRQPRKLYKLADFLSRGLIASLRDYP